MRGRSSLLAAALAMASMSAATSTLDEGLVDLSNASPAAKHRRAGTGPGTKAHQRAARKQRNVQRNRRAHRG